METTVLTPTEDTPARGIRLKNSEVESEPIEEVVEIRKRDTKPKTQATLANDLASLEVLPKVPAEVVQDPDVADRWFGLLTETQFDRLMPYCFRLFPIINRKLVDSEADKNIDVFTRDLWLLAGRSIRNHFVQKHGGGRYKVYVNDSGKKGKQTLFELYLTIPQDEAQPILNEAELELHNPKNASYIMYLQNAGRLNDKKQWIKTEKSTQHSNNNAPNNLNSTGDPAMINAMAGLFKDFLSFSKSNEKTSKLGDDGLVSLFLEKMKQDSPNASLAILPQMMTMFKEMMAASNKSDPNAFSIKDFLIMQENNHKAQMEMMNKMFESKTEVKEPESDLDKLVKWKTLMPEMFGGKRQVTEEKEPETWAGVFKGALSEIGLPLLGIASQLLQMKGANPIIPVTPGQARDMVQPQAMITQPGTSRPIGENLTNPPQSNVVPINANANANAPVQRTLEDLKNEPNFSPMIFEVMTKYGMFFVNALKADNPGEIAGEQVAGMTQMLGANIYQMIKGQGEEKIVGTMKLIPEFWNMTGAVYGEEHIKDFVNRFCNFEKYLDENDDEGNEGVDIGEGRKE